MIKGKELKKYLLNISLLTKLVNWLLTFLWMAIIFYFSSIPNLKITEGLSDLILRKIAHFSVYFILNFLLFRSIIQTNKSNKTIFYSTLFSILYAISDEIHQYFVPTRNFSFVDILIDSAGAFTFLFLLKKSKFPIKLIYVSLLFLIFSGCSIPGNIVKKVIGKEEYCERGMASFYGKDFYGKKTASGEIYTGKDLTAAHRTLPFGTKVKVTRLDNKKSVIVRINDRGPFKKGYIIDLSTEAARRLGMKKSVMVEIRVVE